MREIKTKQINQKEALNLPIGEKVGSYIEKYGINGEAYVGLNEGNPVYIMGLQEAFKGQAEAWVIIFDKSFIAAPREIKNKLVEIFTSGRYTRIGAMGDVDEPISCRFIEWLGFQYEGTLRCYGPEVKDYKTYSLINRR